MTGEVTAAEKEGGDESQQSTPGSSAKDDQVETAVFGIRIWCQAKWAAVERNVADRGEGGLEGCVGGLDHEAREWVA